jgi:Fe2+ or Zn2+ uptake regulation protein
MNISHHLNTNNIKPSIQRIKIFEYLHDNRNHPTVDNIYCDLANEIPTLSKTTVYNTLKLFVENGITSTLTIEGNEVRYDAIMENHAHFKCEKCGMIYDIEIDDVKLKKNQLNGFKVDETNIHLKGKCKKCLTK